jgi:hypothetical protein
MTATRQCLYCDEVGAQWHHVTGRLLFAEYLDPELVVWLCRGCHDLEHRAWREWGLDAIADAAQARLLRLRFFFVRLDILDEPVVFDGSLSRAVGGCLSEIVAAWERR